MLPMLSNAKRTLIAGTVALALVVPSAAPAFAWGKNEQNFTKGVVATLLAGAIIRDMNHHSRPTQPVQPVYYPPQPPVYQPPVQSIYQTPAAQAFNSYSYNERQRIQATLSNYGYYRGSIDGSFGPGTYSAVTAYAARTGKTASLSTRGGAYGFYDALIN